MVTSNHKREMMLAVRRITILLLLNTLSILSFSQESIEGVYESKGVNRAAFWEFTTDQFTFKTKPNHTGGVFLSAGSYFINGDTLHLIHKPQVDPDPSILKVSKERELYEDQMGLNLSVYDQDGAPIQGAMLKFFNERDKMQLVFMSDKKGQVQEFISLGTVLKYLEVSMLGKKELRIDLARFSGKISERQIILASHEIEVNPEYRSERFFIKNSNGVLTLKSLNDNRLYTLTSR